MNYCKISSTFILLFLWSLNVFSQSSCSFTLNKSSIEFGKDGGTDTSLVITSSNCFSGSYVLLHLPDWLKNSKVIGNTIEVKCDPNNGSARSTSIPVTRNGGYNSFMVYQNSSPPPPPPPPPPAPVCEISGFTGHVFNGQGGSFSYPLTFSNCGRNNATFSFTDTSNNPLPSNNWFSISSNSSGNSIIISSTPNLGAPRNSMVVLIHAWSGGTKIDHFGAQISEVSCQQTWYPDIDNDGLGDNRADSILACEGDQPDGWVTNNNDLCPEAPAIDSENGCPEHIVQDDMNWVHSITKNINGAITSDSYEYYNEFGKSIQSRSVDMKTKKVWYSSTIYDEYGRPSLSTLIAPSGASNFYENGDNTNDVGYNPDFVKNDTGNNFSSNDLGTLTTDPSEVSDDTNTLGWYYSDSNGDEDFQDKTSRPYSRSFYSKLNPGTILKTVGGNKMDNEWKQSYSYTMPASQELSQVNAFGENKYDNYQILKTVSRDVHGVEAVVFTDTDGRTLAAARCGSHDKPNLTSREMNIQIGAQGYVDIHIPVGCIGISISGTGASNTRVFDLITEQPVTIAKSSLSAGFYRIAVSNPETYLADTITVSYKENYYDYSLNYYDIAGRLVKSTQPLSKSLETLFKYDINGQVIYSKSPDEGESWILYKEDGQIRFSTNTKQWKAKQFSYTNYDSRGRPIESGVYTDTNLTYLENYTTTTITNPFKSTLKSLLENADGLDDNNCSEVLKTLYDNTVFSVNIPNDFRFPEFLNGNVAKTWNENTTTYYSYDIEGRVKWIAQDIAGIGFKTIDYEYDYVSRQVAKVYYQKGKSDQFIHRYTYDPDDYSLTDVATSINGINFTTHAMYDYYETGALKRLELPEVSQGIDYVYNLQGALKSINHPSLTVANDPGGDSNDIFGMNIHYYKDDYLRNTPKVPTTTNGIDQYNGNIKAITWNIRNQNGTVPDSYYYKYNRNNWLEGASFNQTIGGISGIESVETRNTAITSSQTVEATQEIQLLPGFHIVGATNRNFTAKINTGGTINPNGEYNVSGITYDANGNIQTLNRNKHTDNGKNEMDKLSYQYKTNKPNQLLRVDDAVTAGTNADDIKDQDGNNYIYNDIGQLIEDHEYVTPQNPNDIVRYEYNASGLVTEVSKNNVPLVKFFYNDKNHRVRKEAYFPTGVLDYTEHYVRDAAGTAMAIYRNSELQEHTVYGASRLGVYRRVGNKTTYELTDHLGNVRALVEKGSTQPKGATDYYPFGMVMPARNLTTNQYRYGYQGQEVDPETGKPAFQLRLWDSRIGRWLTTDPYGQFDSPYLGMHNNPINAIDPDGGFSWLGARWFKLWHGGEISKVDGEYGAYYKVTGFESEGSSIAIGKTPTREGWLKAARERLTLQYTMAEQGLDVTFHKNRLVALGHMTSLASPTARFNGLLNATTSTFNKAFKFKIVNATEQQLGALNHAIRRHGDELAELIGKPIKWTKQKNLQPVLDNFNDAVSIIAKHGKKVGTKVVAFGVKGSGQSNAKTLVNVHEYVHNNKTYYLYSRAKDDLFVSAGLKTK